MQGKSYSCKWIEAGLFVGYESLHFCCVMNHGKGSPLIAPWKGDTEFPIGKILKKRDEYRAQTKEEVKDECKNCRYLVEKDWSNESKFLIKHLNLCNFLFCNLRCNYCYITTGGLSTIGPQYDVRKFYQSLLDQNLLDPACVIEIAGGEPTLLPQGTISYIAQNSDRFTIFTNAVKFEQEVFDALEMGPQKCAVVSIDAGTSATYKEKKRIDAYERVVENSARYAQSRGTVIIKYILCEDNISEEDFIGFVEAIKIIRPQMVRVDFDYNKREVPAEFYQKGLELFGMLRAQGFSVKTEGNGVDSMSGGDFEHLQSRASTL